MAGHLGPKYDFATFDGTDWSGSAPGSAYGEIPSITSSTGPSSIAVLNGELDAMFCGIGDDPRMWYTTSQDGVDWEGGTYIPDLVTSDGPTVATFDDQAFAVWRMRPITPSSCSRGRLTEPDSTA